MSTVSEVVDLLHRRGYTFDLNCNSAELKKNKIQDIPPEEFKVDASYRFEGESDPSDEAVVYAISAEKYGLKGVLIDGYGTYSDPCLEKIIKGIRA